MTPTNWFFLSPDLDAGSPFSDPRLIETTERHKIELNPGDPSALRGGADALLSNGDIGGVVLSMSRGWPGRHHLQFARRALKSGRRVWLYWPAEHALEVINDERLASYWRHWLVIQGARQVRRVVGAAPAPADSPTARILAEASRKLEETIARAKRLPLTMPTGHVAGERKLSGTGVYLRTDYWARISSGGSYGHTCYVAKELADSTSSFVAFMPHRYDLLDSMGVRQVVMPPPSATAAEPDLIAATEHYYERLAPAVSAVAPAYIYERLCLGNFAGARLSQDLGVPYIVEYNGSELSMRRSFQGDRYLYEDFFLKAEEAAFKQATLITVVSSVVKDELVSRGVDASRILVNPNGVDPDVYAPPPAGEKNAIRQALGWSASDRVAAFIGSFGGWHGIDVLAEALPRIARARPDLKFLLIGDGSHKHLVDAAIAQHGLQDRVHAAGRVPQMEGARLLRAADIYLSPHSSHMVDSRFFGSPTKLFEYMSLGGGIVASDLEQIGQVLSPAVTAQELIPTFTVTNQRAVLCRPGDVGDFTDAVTKLAGRPDVIEALGRNARAAVLNEFSWHRHVERVWRALEDGANVERVGFASAPAPRLIEQDLQTITTGDEYKDQVQNQWNNNPVGSQYAKNASPHTLEWFLEVEAHRYGVYGPWMPETMEFAKHAGEEVLEIGGGMGTDLAQFAKHGARVTDIDLSAGHLALAQENFRLRGLTGRFIHHDAERLPFDDNSFDVVYSNGVIHHTPNTRLLVDEIYRVLRPGGRAIIMVYAENSLHYWGVQVGLLGIRQRLLDTASVGEIMSRSVEMTANDARPLVKVYTKRRLRQLFERFTDISIVQRQLTAPELPKMLRWVPLDLAGRVMGWNLIIKATKPR
jgi:glycosyltransferase involved in cell wall biosynthesis/ubiquinone/menaquinone biosynthesis C-methylase UbiE